MSLPKPLEAKVKYPVSLDLAMFLSDLEAFFDGALTECPRCDEETPGQVIIGTREHAGHIDDEYGPCPNPNCDQGQVRGPGLDDRMIGRALKSGAPTSRAWVEAIQAELSDSTSPTSPGTGEP